MIELAYIIIFLLASGFFSGIEIAFVSSNKLQVEVIRKKGTKRGLLLAELIEKPSEFLGTTLVGNNIVLVVLSMLSGAYISENILVPYWGITPDQSLSILLCTVVTTFFVLIFGEFLPKVLFRINPTGILYFFTYILVLIKSLLRIVVWVMVKSSNTIINRLFKIETPDDKQVFTRTDLDHFITEITSKSEEEIDTTLFQNALYINHVKVRDCMIPRNEIEAIDISESIDELKQLFIRSTLSRILVYEENIDHIVGYVHHQNLFTSPKNIKSCLWRIPMVHEFTPARDVMNMLIKQKLNLAWVVDERGGTAGIVALEDIFEEIFGEIADEHDQDDWHKKISDTEYVFPGRQEISTLNEEYDFNIPEDEAYHTLSGLIVTRLEEIPEEGQFIQLEEYKLIVEEVSNTKIEQVRIIVDKS